MKVRTMKRALVGLAAVAAMNLGLSPAHADPGVAYGNAAQFTVNGKDVTVSSRAINTNGHGIGRVKFQGVGELCDDGNADVDFAADGSFTATSDRCQLTAIGTFSDSTSMSIATGDLDRDGKEDISLQRAVVVAGQDTGCSSGSCEYSTGGQSGMYRNRELE